MHASSRFAHFIQRIADEAEQLAATSAILRALVARFRLEVEAPAVRPAASRSHYAA